MSLLTSHPGWHLKSFGSPKTLRNFKALKAIGKNKASGPDGFTAEIFLKHWHLVKESFTALFEDFYENGRLNACVQQYFVSNTKGGGCGPHKGLQTNQPHNLKLQGSSKSLSGKTEICYGQHHQPLSLKVGESLIQS
ncbi:putative reverse transcriptase [Cucumis melo var. makuwa]|uniref:Reverse transcriptase n=1 Tax=Cucumis melo var. makuwa TaxID=1194695 RepID=A0A5A7SR52_CUCMM|nr:putative reverse transcriptase [Cucumis melo var. makuwa]